ncbi:MAG: FAD-dependent oxidoreductase [Firmicutes bacterium]|nr:FAD-dependent oxidoreductase [Bacillota bacterium]
MEFTLTLDKKVQARVDTGRCINCRECSRICPTGAMKEYQKAVSGVFSGTGCNAVSDTCSVGCPMGIIPQAVAALEADGEIEKAYSHIIEQNPLAWICAEVCSYPCHESCKLRNIGRQPLDMRLLERDAVRQAQPPRYRFNKPAFDRIAIIGGGPAGIMAAFELRKAGYRPVIFEKRDRLGGAMSWGIPDFRLDKERLHQEIDRLTETGIEIRYNHVIGENYSMQQIREEGFAAVLFAMGRTESDHPDRSLGRGVYDAADLLKEANDGGYSRREQDGASQGLESIGEKVIVVGGGRMAADIAQILAARGKNVTCMIPEKDGKDFSEETKAVCSAAGIQLRQVTGIGQVIRDAEGVKAVEILDGAHANNVFCDAVVFEFDQKCRVEHIIKAETRPDGSIRIDAAGRTNKKGIYACGEVTGETSSVVEALAAGRLAARAIDADLRSAGETITAPAYEEAPAGETIYPENVAWEEEREAIGRPGEEAPAGDILPVLRLAGIAEDMPQFFRDEGPEQTAGKGRVAVIGGGIAGITAAIALARKGVRPTIYEKTSRLGGSSRWLATNRRFDRQRMDQELQKVEASGIRVLYNTTGGVRPDILDMLKEYDAVLFAVGESQGSVPEIPGADARGVYDIVRLMQEMNSHRRPVELGSRVVVAGSDETSVDAARALKRICPNVTLLSDCGRGKLQIKTSCVDLLLEEGINIVTGVTVAQINTEHGAVAGVNCSVTENGSSLGVPCDTVVFGEGRQPDLTTISLKNLYLDLDEKGYIKVNSRLAASMRGVFAIGDFNMSSVDAGKAGAAAVMNFLEHTDQAVIVEHFRPEEMAVEHERIQGKNVDLRPSQDAAAPALEARRCISCGYHQAAESRCIGCGICQKYCPVGAIWMDGVQQEVE